jgi:hypothetical protein
MTRLIEHEFGISPLPESFSALWAARQEGAQQAARCHVERACRRHGIRRAGRARVYVNDPSDEHRLNTYTAMDTTLDEHTSSEHEDPARKRICHEEMSGIRSECTSGTSCSSYPWLAPDDGLPYFLWDTHESRTVEVSSLKAILGSSPSDLATHGDDGGDQVAESLSLAWRDGLSWRTHS